MPISLLYHDVVRAGAEESSGFPGPGAKRYKITPEEFGRHLEAIAAACRAATGPAQAQACGCQPPGTTVPGKGASGRAGPVLLTFDDGGVSAATVVREALEAKGWRGLFFVTTDYVGKPGFLEPRQVRQLRGAGHVIGSHSCSHPARMSSCSWGMLVGEWRRSREALEDLLGEEVTAASVPGGFYSRRVAEAAAEAGVRVLFNSEPTARATEVRGCEVRGRYTIYRKVPAATAAALAAGRLAPRIRQAVLWKLKQVAKSAGGLGYLRTRERLLGRVYGRRAIVTEEAESPATTPGGGSGGRGP